MPESKVTLAGKEYPVPELVPLQQREIEPALRRALTFIDKHKEEKLFTMDREFIDDSLLIVYWGAIWPNDESIKFDQFLRMKIKRTEIISALPVIQLATGLFDKKTPQEGGTPGESQSQ